MKRALSKVCNIVSRRAMGPAETNGRRADTQGSMSREFVVLLIVLVEASYIWEKYLSNPRFIPSQFRGCAFSISLP